MAVTIKDIAKRVGVSPSTVSRVINGSSSISTETAQKIQEVMEELNYHPNSLARNFANGNTYSIGLVIDAQDDMSFANAFFNRSVFAIEMVAQSRGFNILITNDREKQKTSPVENLVFEKKVDGIILPSSNLRPQLLQKLNQNNFPFAIMGEPQIYKAETSWVDINNMQGSEMAVGHLIAQGYTKIAFVTDRQETMFARNRLNGYYNGLSNAGISVCNDFVIEGSGDLSWVYEAACSILMSSNPPDAFLCANNLIAFHVLKALKEKKIKVPNQVGVVTFDNYPIAEYTDPPLTSVDVDTFSLGEQVANILINKIQRESGKNQQTLISTNLIQRESTNRKERLQND